MQPLDVNAVLDKEQIIYIMKKYIFPLSFIVAVLISGFTFVDIFLDDDDRDLPTFDRIALRLPCNVHITQGSKQSVVLKGDRDDLEKIITEVSGGKLIIKTKSSSWLSWMDDLDEVDIYITMKEVRGLSVSGSGKITTENKIKTDDLDLAVSGSGRLQINVDANEIDSSISGSGRIEAKGTSKSNDLSISGSGRLNAENLVAENYDISISGSGRCEINVTNELEVSISGSGSVYYKGNPDKVDSKTSGSGRVKKM